jgi:hypothetical protein
LKDARHHNDKGAWILQLREISKAYPTIRGTVAILAGYWTEGVAVMFESEGRVRMVQVAKDDEIYQTLQPSLDTYLHSSGLAPLQLNAVQIRQRLPRAKDVSACLTAMKENGTLGSLAREWLQFQRTIRLDGSRVLGRDLVVDAIDELLAPYPETPLIDGFEISLRVNTGNTIYQRFNDKEDLIDFIEKYTSNPQAIRDIITPRRFIPKDDEGHT